MTTHQNADSEIRAVARRRLLARRDFTVTVSIFAAVAVLLLVIWLMTSPGGYFWPIWPILGMALASVLAALNAFGTTRGGISEAEIIAEIDRLRGR